MRIFVSMWILQTIPKDIVLSDISVFEVAPGTNRPSLKIYLRI